jgi:hemoglobin
MKPDIASRDDIDLLMAQFYGKAMSDPEIGHFFTEVVQLDLEHHLPVIGDFWESHLFGAGLYARHGRNPLQIHAAMSRKVPLRRPHFQRWLKLFTETIDESFAGIRAEFLKQRGQAIAGRMLEFVSRGV